MTVETTTRRHNSHLADQVQWAISLMRVAGLQEARRYMVNAGMLPYVLDRVIRGAAQQRHAHGVRRPRAIEDTTKASPKMMARQPAKIKLLTLVRLL